MRSVLLVVLLTHVCLCAALAPTRQLLQQRRTVGVSTAEELLIAAESAQNGDAIVIQRRRLDLPNTVRVTARNVELRGREQGTTLTCPEGVEALSIQGRGVTVTDLHFVDCRDTTAVVIEGGEQRRVSAVLRRVAFRDNQASTLQIASQLSESAPLLIRRCPTLFEECDTSELTVRLEASNFTNNQAYYGGAVHSVDAVLQIEDCQFSGNRAEHGGAIHVWGTQSNVTLINSRFVNNRARGRDAVSSVETLADGSPIEQTEFWIFERPSASGGAIYTSNAAHISIQNCQFIRNRAPAGGAVSLDFDSGTGPSTAEILNSTFHRNRAQTSQDAQSRFQLGGAVYLDSSIESLSFRIFNCSFTDNTARYGGGLHLIALQDTQPVIDRTLFANNSASEAGGAILLRNAGQVRLEQMACLNNFALLAGCVMVTNQASLLLTGTSQGIGAEAIPAVISGNQAASGGAIACAICRDVVLRQAIFENNTAGFSGGAIYILESDSSISIERSSLLHNAAFVGGAVAIEDARDVRIAGALDGDTLFTENLAVSGAAIHAVASNKRQNNLQIDLCRFEENAAVRLSAFLRDPRIAALLERLSTEPLYPAIHVDPELDLRSRISPCQEGGGGALCFVLDNIPAQTSVQYKLLTSVIEGNRAVVGGGLFAAMASGSEWNANNAADCEGVGDLYDPCRHFSFQDVTLRQNSASFAPGIFTHLPEGIALRCDSQDATSLFEVVQDVKQSPESDAEQIYSEVCNSIVGNEASREAEINTEGRSRKARIRNERYTDVGTGLHRLVIPASMQNIRNHTGGEFLTRDCTSYRDAGMDCPVERGPVEIDVLDLFGQRIVDGVPDASQEVLLTSADIRGVLRYVAVHGVVSMEGTVGMGIGNASTVRIEARDAPEISTELHFVTRECLPGERTDDANTSCVQCPSQQYSFDRQECIECEDHAVCPGGAALVPQSGFWHSTPFSPQFHECIFRDACSYEGRETNLTNFYSNLDQLQSEMEQLMAAIEADEALQYQPRLSSGNETTSQQGAYPQCAPGYSGALCGSCVNGYGRLASGECTECGSQGESGWLIFLLSLWMTLVVGINVVGAFESTRRQMRLALQQQPPQPIELQQRGPRGPPVERLPDENGHNQGMDGVELVGRVADRIVAMLKLTETFKIFTNYCQVTAAAASININWPKAPEVILWIATFVVGFASGSNFKSLSCYFGSDEGDPSPSSIKYLWMRAAFPLIILAFFFLLCGVYVWAMRHGDHDISQQQTAPGPSRAARPRMSHRSYFIVITIVVIFYSYISITTELMKTVNCIKVDERGTDHVYDVYAVETAHRVWAEDTSLYCFEGDHTATGVFGILGIIFFTCGTVLFVMLWLPWNANRLDQPEFIAQYGFIYQAYREIWYTTFWEGVIASRKALLMAALVFAVRLGPNLQAVSALGVIILSIALQIIFEPFKRFDDHPNVPISEIDPFSTVHWWVKWNDLISLNVLETVSLFMSGVVFYAGLVFNDDNTTDVGRNLMAVFMVLTNGVYFIYMLYRLYAGAAVALDYACGHIRHVSPDLRIPKGHGPLTLLRKTVAVFKYRKLFDLEGPRRHGHGGNGAPERI